MGRQDALHSAEMNTQAWVIYGLHEAGCTKIMYVGFSTRPRRRLTEHRWNAMRHGYKCPVHRWMCHIMRAGRKVEMTILERGIGDWKAAEQKWVAYYGRPNLLNATDGGDGFPDVPEESRLRAGEKLRLRTLSAEHRLRISKAKKGCKRPDAAKYIEDYMRRLDPEQVSANAKRARSCVTPDGERSLKAALTRGRRNRWANLTPEKRAAYAVRVSESMRAIWAARKGAQDVAIG